MSCRLCDSKDVSKISIEDIYYFCNNCELIFIDQDDIPSYEKEHKVYLGHENTHNNEGYVNMFEFFINNFIKEHLNEINDVLEFGCGPGPVFANLLKNRGLNVTKYDPFFYPDEGYKEKKYDLITSTEVFEHFQDPKKEIEDLIDLMNLGSYLGIMTSFHQGRDHFKKWWYRRDITHTTFYNIKTFKYIEDKYPLKIIDTDNKKHILLKKKF